jgi:hypothetical protein
MEGEKRMLFPFCSITKGLELQGGKGGGPLGRKRGRRVEHRFYARSCVIGCKRTRTC